MASEPPVSPFKSRSGIARLMAASRYSAQGLVAAWRHEAAFRQELVAGTLLLAIGLSFVDSIVGALLLIGSVLFVLVVELLNSALEALADSVSIEHRPLLGRAKDLGSAAVLLALCVAVCIWLGVFWPG
ncbi:MAG: diacylglycerol kinase [Lautropia sp.]